MKPAIFLICGYRRTGKDMLYSILSNSFHQSDRFKWRVYKQNTDLDSCPQKLNLLDKCEKNSSMRYLRVAYADSLKAEASEIYNIPPIISDENKDVKQFTHYNTGNLVSARDIYIELGSLRRSQDIDYWCKLALKPHNCHQEQPTTCIITDWRFPSELIYAITDFCDVTTIRVYRSDIPEPPIDIESEHSLDNFCTYYLLLRDDLDGEFERAVERFPQYASYIPLGCI